MSPALVAVAHGSRDARSMRTIHALVEQVRTLAPELDVRTSFLDLAAPRLTDALGAVRGDGHREAIVVPLLLGHAFHARVDVPTVVADIQRWHPKLHVEIADVLGPDQQLEQAAWQRLCATGIDTSDPELGVILAGAGSAHQPANDLVAGIAQRWQRVTNWAGSVAAFAAAAEPDVPAAIAALRRRGARRFALGSWFLAPGLLPDRVVRLAREHADEVLVAEPLGADPRVADLVLRRYAEALTKVSLPTSAA